MTSTDKFVGYLVSVECKDIFYQGIVTQIDSNKALIQLKNVFQNGIHCGSKLIDIKTTEIENIEILADPQNALTILKPKTNEIEQNLNITNAKQLNLTNKITNNTFLNSNDNNNNNSNNNKNTQPIKVSSQKHIKISNSHSANNTSHSNISPASVSPPYYQNDFSSNSNKRKSFNGYSNGHDNSNNQFGSNNNIGSVNVETIVDEFDFEKNLALFDKNKFYEEVGQPVFNNSSNPTSVEPQLNAYDSLIKQLNSNKETPGTGQRYHQISVANLFSSQATPVPNTNSISTTNANELLTPNTNGLLINSATVTKTPNLPAHSSNNSKNYRFDEMVLGTGEPVNLQQIQVPCNITKRYVTDDGFFIPCINNEIRIKLFEQSYKYGFTKQRQIECMGRCCTEMALQLIGGPLRFSPKNNHQKPTILILANDQNIKDSYAMCAARLLLIRSCKVFLFISKKGVQNEEDAKYFNCELNLFQSIDPPENTFLKNIDELRNLTSVDLIINSLDGESANQTWYRELIKYVDTCKASVVSIDPVKEGTPIKSKWCILPVLPYAMSENCGRVYLCDLGFTKSMFNSVDIKYQSPFGAKFLIPLHND